MKPIHIHAKPGHIAERVLVAGDPGRIRKLSKLLEGRVLVNRNRGYLIYTGTYNGARITLATHGIGGPSAAIVLEELAMLGAKTFVRFGTAGALSPEVKIGDYVIPTDASHVPGGNATAQYFEKADFEATPDSALSEKLAKAFADRNLKFHRGKVFTSDALYAEEEGFAEKHFKNGNIAVEMECAILFKLSRLRGWRSASALVVSDSLVGKAVGEHWISKRELNNRVMEGAKVVLGVLAEA
ncbi:MAG: purine-nucleoside phosphorylase [Candidatus Micrarchaeota archaeon]|nr:purine-nucleoside phosphorylase [Candidatus Micrarchaeota archaeon]